MIREHTLYDFKPLNLLRLVFSPNMYLSQRMFHIDLRGCCIQLLLCDMSYMLDTSSLVCLYCCSSLLALLASYLVVLLLKVRQFNKNRGFNTCFSLQFHQFCFMYLGALLLSEYIPIIVIS